MKEANITGTHLKHTIHLEDLLYDGGNEGADLLIRFIKDIQSQFSGHSDGKNIKTKFDGAPSLLVASDFHGETFVGTKGLFSGKVCYTNDDINKWYGDREGLAEKLRIFLEYAKELQIPKDQFWQGDILYSHSTLNSEEKDGENLITFHPNTIVYAVPESDPLAGQITASEAGIAWHTRYRGESIEQAKASFDVSKKELKDIPEIVSLDANLPSIAGVVTFTQKDSDYLDDFIKTVESYVNRLKEGSFLEEVKNGLVSKYLNMFENFNVKTYQQQLSEDSADYLDSFSFWVNSRYQKELEKSGERKSKRLNTELSYLKDFISTNKDKLILLLDTQKTVLHFKDIIIKKLDKLGSLRPYIKKTSKPGLFTTGQEGFVISDMDGNIAKLVSRLDFSRNNFSSEIVKGWDSVKRHQEKLSPEMKQKALDYIDSLLLTPVNDKIVDKSKSYIDDKPTAGAQVRPEEDMTRKDKATEVLNNVDPDDVIEADIPTGDTRPVIILNRDDYVLALEFKDKKGASKKLTATETKQMESWWMYFMKAKLSGEPYPTKEETKEGFPKMDDNWYQSFISGSEAVYDYVNGDSEYFFSRENDQIPKSNYPPVHAKVDEFFKKKKNLMAGVGKKTDAWNPSDLYLCHKSYIDDFFNDWDELIDNPDATLEDANTILAKALSEKLLIGISLKKLTNPSEPHVDNSKDVSTAILNCKLTRVRLSTFIIDKSPAGLRAEGAGFDFSVSGKKTMDISGQFRYFGDTAPSHKYCGPLRVELKSKGAAAQLGKLPSIILNFYLDDLGVDNIPDINSLRSFVNTFSDQTEINKLVNYAKNIEMNLGSVCNVKESEVSEYFRDLAILRQSEKRPTKEFIKAGSIVQGLYFVNMLAEAAKQGMTNEILSDMLKRSSKMHTDNAPYVKLS